MNPFRFFMLLLIEHNENIDFDRYMIVIDDDNAVRYGRISGNDFIACNDDNCSHYDHANRKEKEAWEHAGRIYRNDADFMLKRLSYGFYDDMYELIWDEADRLLESHLPYDYARMLSALAALNSVYDETREVYGLMMGIASDMYDYRIMHNITDPVLMMNDSNDGMRSMIGHAREYAAWFGMDIGSAIEHGTDEWHVHKPSRFHVITVDMDDYGVIKRFNMTDEDINSESWETERFRYNPEMRRSIIRELSGEPFLFKDMISLTACCLQIDGFLTGIRTGMLKPVLLNHVIPPVKIRRRTNDESVNAMISVLSLQA